MRIRYYEEMDNIYCNQGYDEVEIDRVQAKMRYVANAEEKFTMMNDILPEPIRQLRILSVLEY